LTSFSVSVLFLGSFGLLVAKQVLIKKKLRDVDSLRSYGPALFHATEKLVPSVDSDDGEALVVVPLLVTIVIV